MAGKRTVVVFLLLLALVAGACRTAPLYQPHVTFSARDVGSVEQAILHALANRRWLAKQEGAGVIIGTLNLRTHQAVVRIEFTADSYSIRYVDSKELLYERKANGDQVIHQHYNGWIAYLVKDINAGLGV